MSEELNEIQEEEFSKNGMPVEQEEVVQKYLAFKSDNLIFGIMVENVIEIITNHTATLLPRVPDYIQGIINLRGQIIPIIDIRLRMNKPAADIEEQKDACVIIIELDEVTIGILVDEMLQVFDIKTRVISSPSKNQPFVNGLIHLTDGSVMFCLDCELLVSSH